MAWIFAALGVAVSIGWAGMSRGLSWRDLDTFNLELDRSRSRFLSSDSKKWRFVVACLVAAARYRPEFVMLGFFGFAVVLRTAAYFLE